MSGYNDTFYNRCGSFSDGIAANNVILCQEIPGLSGRTLQDVLTDIASKLDKTIGLMVVPTDPLSAKVKVKEGKYRSLDGRRAITRTEIISPEFTPITNLPRIDLLCIDDNGNLSIVMGAEAATPTAPIYPTDRLTIAEVRIDETTEVYITTEDIRNTQDVLGPSTIYSVDGGSF